MARRVRKQSNTQPRRRLIGVDIGKSCGYGVVDVGGGLPMKRVASGTWNFGNARNMGGGMLFIKFNQQLGALMRQTKPAGLGYEVVRFRHNGSAAAQVYFGMESQLTALCESMQIPFEGYGPGTIKKVAAGHGHASKELVQQVMDECFGTNTYETKSDNEADALGAAVTLARVMGWDDAKSKGS